MLELTAIGNLVADPTFRTIRKNEENVKVANFRIAVNGANGTVDYVDVNAWRHNADICQYLTKGRQVFVRGYPKSTHGISRTNNQIYDNLELTMNTIQFLSGGRRAGSNMLPDEHVNEVLHAEEVQQTGNTAPVNPPVTENEVVTAQPVTAVEEQVHFYTDADLPF